MDSVATEVLEEELGEPIARAVDDVAAAKLLYGGRVDFWLSGRTSAFDAAKAAGLAPPKVAFDWRPADLGIACNRATDQSILDQLRDANTARLKLLHPAP